MRVVFMGTPAFVLPIPEALLEAGHQLVGVYTQADKPAGRGRSPRPSAVKEFALRRGIPVFQPATLRRPEPQAQLRALGPDAIVLAAYGKILPKEVLGISRLGGLNVHPSLLPRHRGAAPLQSTILAGDTVTGVTIFLMDEGMDTGAVLAQAQEPVRPDDTADSLAGRLFVLGARLLVETLERWGRGEITPQPQDEAKATYTAPLRKEQGRLDFTQPAALLARQVRAYHPWPGTWTAWKGRLLKVLEAELWTPDSPVAGDVGQVIALPPGAPAPAGVVTGQGVLALKRLQLEGKRPVACDEFLRGYRGFVGARLGA
ncbi:MAG: methionyl-tRNA formyltransferase [Chloroflexi bacterium]|nr:methionyl-tRNA formyltransferase [Chloroflexota bacterium]